MTAQKSEVNGLQTSPVVSKHTTSRCAPADQSGTSRTMGQVVRKNVAICIAGEYRTHAFTQGDIFRFVIEPLLQSYRVDVYYALDADSYGPLLNHSGIWRGNVQYRAAQFLRLEKCRSMFVETYDWAIRLRPDLSFGQQLPALSRLNEAKIHIRFRCLDVRKHSRIRLGEISQELQTGFARNCKDGERCNCHFWGCYRNSSVHAVCNRTSCVDDQFAVVPKSRIDAYFSSHHMRVTSHPKSGSYTLTRSLMDQSAPLEPISVQFCIQRGRYPCFMHNPNRRFICTYQKEAVPVV